MKIQGHQISEAQLAACLARMRQDGTWNALAIEQVAERAGVESGYVAFRLADRLIQRERKAGHITQVTRGVWRWCV